MAASERRHILVIANETVAGRSLIEALKRRADEHGVFLVTVVTPVSRPREGYVVYEDTRRASAGRRLDRTLSALREAGVAAHGFVVDSDPVDAVRDQLAMLEPRPTEIVVSTHPAGQSGWVRRNVIDRIRKAAAGLPVEHVVVDLDRERGAEANVLVVANETVLGEPLLERIRERARRSPATFLVVAPQSDVAGEHTDAERRLRRAVAQLRGEGLEVHGQIAHPDPYTATMHAVRDERIDEIIVSTYPNERSGWLRRDLVGRVRRETKLPVDHVVVAPEQAAAGAGTT
jgi:predicted deacetylase